MPDDDQQEARAGPRFRLAVPVFNGARENVKVVSYLTKAQLWVTASGTPDAEAASALIFAMTGDAEIFGLNLVNKEEAAAKSWTELKKKIREVFLVDLTSAERKKIRMQLKQEQGEHPLDFFNRLEATQHLLQAAEYTEVERALEIFKKTSESELEMLFQAGLESELARKVGDNPTVKDLKTLKTAVALHWPATKAAMAAASNKKNASASSATSPPLQTVPTTATATVVKAEPSAEVAIDEMDVEELRTQLRAARLDVGRGRGRGRRGGGRGRGQNPNQGQFQARERGACFKCGETGHFIASCPRNTSSRGRGRGFGRGGAAPSPGSRGYESSTSTEEIKAAVVEALRSMYEVKSNARAYENENANVDYSSDHVAHCESVHDVNSSFLSGVANSRPTVNVRVVDGGEVIFLIDSGSAVTIMREDVFLRLENNHLVKRESIPAGLSLRSANKSTVNALYVVNLSLEINGGKFENVSIIICRELASDAILGSDFLTRHKAIIFCNDKKVEFLAEVAALPDINAHARLSRNLHAHPFSTTSAEIEIVRIDATDKVVESHAIIAAIHENLRTLGLSVEPSLVKLDPSNPKMRIRVFNTASAPVAVDKGSILAYAEILQADADVEELEWIADTSAKPVLSPPSPEMRAQIEREAVIGSKDPKVRKQYIDLLCKYHQAISQHSFDFGRFKYARHNIRTKNENPVHVKQFPLPYAHRPAITAHMEKLLKAGVISQCKDSQYNTPFFCIKKKDGVSLRVLQDLRKLNENSVEDRYIFSDVQSCIDAVGQSKAKVFSILDVTAGYYHLQLSEESKPKTAFTLPNNMWLKNKKGKLVTGRFLFDLLSMGLHGSGSSFSKIMAYVVRDIEALFGYMDDLFLYCLDDKHMLSVLELVLERLVRYNIKISLTKARLGMSSVQYLGHEFGARGVQPASSNVQALIDIPPPRTVAQLRSFCGVANFFRQYVSNYASVAAHLTRLTRKFSRWSGGILPPNAFKAFKNLKAAIGKRPVLRYPRFDLPFEVHVDAAAGDQKDAPGGLGCILVQRDGLGHPHPVIFASRSLKDHERNYSVSALECAAVHFALNKFQVYLKGRRCKVFTDHKPLLSATVDSSNKTIARLLQQVADFDFELLYRPGKICISDALSRNPSLTVEQLEFVQDKTAIIAAQKSDPFCSSVRLFLLDGTLPENKTHARIIATKSNKWVWQSEILWLQRSNPLSGVRKALIVPQSLQQQLVRRAHKAVCSGHRGIFATYHRVALRHYWPNLYDDVVGVCTSCETCQRTKTPPNFRKHSLQPWPVPASHGERVHTDLFGPVAGSDGAPRYIMSIVDAFSKFAEFVILPNKEATTVAHAFFAGWIARHGVPRVVVSDFGSEYVNRFFKELSDTFGIEHCKAAAMNHQTNGLAERMFRSLNAFFTTLLQEHQVGWETMLPALQLAVNSTTQKSSKFSPWMLVFGKNPSMPWWEIVTEREIAPGNGTYVQRLVATLSKVCRAAEENETVASGKMKQYFDRTPRVDRIFQKGDEVLLYFPPESFRGVRRKWRCRWVGPFIVTERVNETSYRIKDENGKVRKAAVHVNRLKRFRRDENFVDAAPPPAAAAARRHDNRDEDSSDADSTAEDSPSSSEPQSSSSASSDSDSDTDFQSAPTTPAAEPSSRVTRSAGPVVDLPLPRLPIEYRPRKK